MSDISSKGSGYIYVLQNDAHDPFIVKIGLTTREPNVRAKELYQGKSGVPLKFSIAVAFSTEDCFRAEKLIHERLDTYRINPKREFFRISLNIAVAIAKESCEMVNRALGIVDTTVHKFEKEEPPPFIKKMTGIYDEFLADSTIVKRKVSELKMAPIGTSKLSPAQIDRIRILQAVFAEVCHQSVEKWLENFSRDRDPGREIIIWENMAKVYQKFESTGAKTSEEKEEAFGVVLTLSMGTVPGDIYESDILSPEAIESIVESCTNT